ncbi:MAG: hypothetical protein V4687_17105 [Bacteroidota bacterium]
MNIETDNTSNTPQKPINEEIAGGYNSADDTGNSAEDLELELSDDADTDLDLDDLDALNGIDLDDDETMS